jgi:hypothetical protein
MDQARLHQVFLERDCPGFLLAVPNADKVLSMDQKEPAFLTIRQQAGHFTLIEVPLLSQGAVRSITTGLPKKSRTCGKACGKLTGGHRGRESNLSLNRFDAKACDAIPKPACGWGRGFLHRECAGAAADPQS